MGNVGEPVRRWTGVPDEEPLQLPEQFPDHEQAPAVEPAPPVVPERPLTPV